MGIWEQFLQSSEVRILLYLFEKKEVRYSKFKGLVKSRATIDWALRQLVERGLIKRKMIDTPPIHTVYTLTAKGLLVVKQLRELTRLIIESK